MLFLWILTASDFAIGDLDRGRAKAATAARIRLLLGAGRRRRTLRSWGASNTRTLGAVRSRRWSACTPIRGSSISSFRSASAFTPFKASRISSTSIAGARSPCESRSTTRSISSFFPQLLAGPIVRAGLFFGELFSWRPPGPDDVSYGLARAGFGLLKKTAIADPFASVANAYFDGIASHPGALAAWSAMFAFSMQIYFDFSGYSDIAIGCARLLGFVFPENFRMPYLATSIGDFWHRWHITLSTWLRDYLYVPLGGSRHGLAATLRNLMVTMLLGGLWHGAQWTFVAWGGFHGTMLCIERLFGIGRKGSSPAGVALVARVTLTFADRHARLGSLPGADLRRCAWGVSRALRRWTGRVAFDGMVGGACRRNRCLRSGAPGVRPLEHDAGLAGAASRHPGGSARRLTCWRSRSSRGPASRRPSSTLSSKGLS